MDQLAVPWQLPPTVHIPANWTAHLQRCTRLKRSPHFLAQILWQRGIRDMASLPGFLDADQYQPTNAAAFGNEMERAVARLKQAYEQNEKVAIWGDFGMAWGNFFSRAIACAILSPTA